MVGYNARQQEMRLAHAVLTTPVLISTFPGLPQFGTVDP